MDNLATLEVGTGKTAQERRDSIVKLEQELFKHEQIPLEVFQHFCDGVYMRELHIPAGVILTGKIHKASCLNILLQGEIEVATEEGPKHLKAPQIFSSPAGVKRAGNTITDTMWVTVHSNPENINRDPDAMAELYTMPDFDALENTTALSDQSEV